MLIIRFEVLSKIRVRFPDNRSLGGSPFILYRCHASSSPISMFLEVKYGRFFVLKLRANPTRIKCSLSHFVHSFFVVNYYLEFLKMDVKELERYRYVCYPRSIDNWVCKKIVLTFELIQNLSVSKSKKLISWSIKNYNKIKPHVL